MRGFLPAILRGVRFEATPAGRDTLRAVHFLSEIEGIRKPDMSKAPLDGISRSWRPLVVGPENKTDRRGYTLCTIERLQEDLRRRDIFVADSEQWNDPRSKLLNGEHWFSAKPDGVLGTNSCVLTD